MRLCVCLVVYTLSCLFNRLCVPLPGKSKVAVCNWITEKRTAVKQIQIAGPGLLGSWWVTFILTKTAKVKHITKEEKREREFRKTVN